MSQVFLCFWCRGWPLCIMPCCNSPAGLNGFDTSKTSSNQGLSTNFSKCTHAKTLDSTAGSRSARRHSLQSACCQQSTVVEDPAHPVWPVIWPCKGWCKWLLLHAGWGRVDGGRKLQCTNPAKPLLLQAAQEGADGEDNESLGGSSNQLARPSQLAALSWGAPTREPSQSFSSRLARISGPAGDGDAAADALAECDGCEAANGPVVPPPEPGGHRAAGGGAAARDGTAEPSAPPRAQAAAAPAPGRLHDCEQLHDSAAAAGHAGRRSADAPRQPPSISDSVSTVPAGHSRKGSIHGHKGRRHCCVM